MGFMEMKRVNQDLVSELQAIREASAQMESKHQSTVDTLTQEIMATRVSLVKQGAQQPPSDELLLYNSCPNFLHPMA